LLWFGPGSWSLVFVLIPAVLWSVALNAHSGSRSAKGTACGRPQLERLPKVMNLTLP
jgi:hypothetical protein